MGEPAAPQLPKGAPEGLAKFLACEKDTVTLKDGELTWVSVHGSDVIPAGMAPVVPDKILKGTIHPSMTITPDPSGPGKASIKIGIDVPGLGTVGPSVPASIDNGTLSVDTAGLPHALKDPIDSAVKNLNDWFKSKGKGLAAPAFGAGQTGLSKVDLAPAPAVSTPPPTPVPVPDPQKPPPPPPPPPDSPPTPLAAGTDWSHLSPTSEQWDKALAETKVEPPKVEPPKGEPPTGPKPLVGAGGPGGPKAPVGLGDPAIRYIVALVLVALVAGAVWFAGPSLGLFGSNPSPGPSGTQIAGNPSPSEVPTPSPTHAPRVAASSDGLVTLTIPDGSAPADTAITVTPLGQADAPPELAGVTFRSSFYRIGPSDLTFAGPVTIDRRIDLTALGVDVARQGYPVISLALRTSVGKWSWLPDQQLTFVDHGDGAPIEYELHVAATVPGAGDVFGFSSGVVKRYRLDPPGATYQLGASFSSYVTLQANTQADNLPPDQRPHLTSVQPFASVDGVVGFGPVSSIIPTTGPSGYQVPVTCATLGSLTVGAKGKLAHALLPNDLLTRLDLGTDLDLGFATGADIRCAAGSAASPTPLPMLTAGCISVVHKPPASGVYPSHLHFVLTFAGELPSNETLRVSYREGTGDALSFDDIPIVRGMAVFDTGITSYGTKTIVALETYGGSATLYVDFTQQAVSIFGQSFKVTEKEGSLAGNACPTPILTP